MTTLADLYQQEENLKRFALLRKLGEGIMSSVYQCHDKETEDVVAIKVIRGNLVEDEQTLTLLKQDIKILRKISQRNICRIFDLGVFPEHAYVVMDYIEGVQLSSIIRVEGLMPDFRKVPIALKILEGIETAHQHDLAHLNIRPNNILITSNFEPVITDLGLARCLETQVVTDSGRILDNIIYLSPEQIADKNVDYRADIYSFGLLLYELLTKQLPFPDSDPFSMALDHFQQKPTSPREYNPYISESLENIIMKCLEKDRDFRYQNTTGIIQDIQNTFQLDQTKSKAASKLKALVADDDPLYSITFSEMLKKLEMDVILCSNGLEAVSKCIEEKPDIIFMEVALPKINGILASEILLSTTTTRKIPIVIVSSKTDEECIISSSKIGVKDYLVKPVQIDDIKQRLKFWLNK
ncbi:protein kinase [candidate division CSSED10-310 bacterium]|uniref:Protein kinase n=1 Tax=candidate division CSSED10-310 bacterium TaxID=2855610 RepID=A0ABV6YSS0_UNCC1